MTMLAGTSQTAERSLDREVMMFDLAAILGNMKQEPTWQKAKRNAMTLVKQPVFRVVLVALQAGCEIGAHETEGPVTVQGLAGRLVIHVGEEEMHLAAGQLLVLRPGLRHSMHAREESAFLLTLAADALHPAEHLI